MCAVSKELKYPNSTAFTFWNSTSRGTASSFGATSLVIEVGTSFQSTNQNLV